MEPPPALWDPHPSHVMPLDPHLVPWNPDLLQKSPQPRPRTPQSAMGPAKCTKDPHPILGTPSAVGFPIGAPHCLSAGSEDTQTQGQRGQGTHGLMGALTSLTLPALSLEPSSLGPPTPPIHSSLRGGHPPPLGDMGCCGGGHPGVHSSPSTPNPAPWERVRKRGGYGGTWGDRGGHMGGHQGNGPWPMSPTPLTELHQVHSTPLLVAGPSHIPVTGTGGEWGTGFGLAARQPQQRGHEGDTATAVMDSRDPQLPAFSSPKPHRGSSSLASGVTMSPVTPPRPPHAWHPPVTR